jgi:Polysaccharide lyase family 4, domain II
MNRKFRFAQSARRALSMCAFLVPMGLTALLASGLASAYQVVAVTNGGTIDGYVTLSGTAPTGAALKVTKNQDVCGSFIPDPTYSVGRAGGLQNVIVYLKGITSGKAAPDAAPSLVDDHCMINPRVQGAMVGEQVRISSNDPILHNAHAVHAESNSTIYNIALPFQGVSVVKPLPDSPGLIKIKSDAQEWMHAWIMELDHPYYATTDADGHFIIKDVPPGSYTLVAWHEAAGESSEPVVIAAGGTATSMMSLTADNRVPHPRAMLRASVP